MRKLRFKNFAMTCLKKKYQKKKEEYKRNLHEINDWCKNNIIIDGKKFSFPDVVKADFDTLSKIVEKLDNLKASFHYSPPPYEKIYC